METRLSSSSRMVLFTPSMSKPNRHFVVSNVPSPLCCFLLRWGLGIVLAWGKYVAYSVQDPPCNMIDLSLCCWYDARDDGINIHLKDIVELVILLPIVDQCGFHSCPVFEFVLW